MVLHIELNSWAQAEQHFRDLDQDQGREHYDRDMFNCELALNILGIGTLFSCGGHLDGLAAFPYITIIPQRAVAGLVPRYISIMETQPLSQGALAVKHAIAKAMSELGQHLWARPRAADVHADLVGLAHLVLHMRQRPRFVLGSGPAQRTGLVVHQVREVILDGPPRAAGRQIPLPGRQARAQLVNR